VLFNSIDFSIFFIFVFFIYWFVFKKNLILQNIFLLITSYIFYGWWDSKFLILILITTISNFAIALLIQKKESLTKKKLLLYLSILINLGILAYFKYYNFFIESLIDSFLFFGKKIKLSTIQIILPVGISFYTFQTLSYTIDVYKKKYIPTQDFIQFANYVSFFPQLAAGPIERADFLLPQFKKTRIFNYAQAVNGCRQILWGLFKKVVIADSCANYKNFNYPYFATSITDFWRRWHISLSTWFRDYIYYPLGGNKQGYISSINNLFLVFIISGFWHGANWKFIFWGALNSLFLITERLIIFKENIKKRAVLFKPIMTYGLITFSWVFFRAESITDSFNYTLKIFSFSKLSLPYITGNANFYIKITPLILFLIFIEWHGRNDNFAIEKIELKFNKLFRWIFYFLITFMIFLLSYPKQDFIYFQF